MKFFPPYFDGQKETSHELDPNTVLSKMIYGSFNIFNVVQRLYLLPSNKNRETLMLFFLSSTTSNGGNNYAVVKTESTLK